MPNIKDLGGLTDDQIQNLVLRNNQAQTILWDSRMDTLRAAIDERFDKHEEKVDKKFDEFLERFNQSQESWRAGLGDRLTKQDTMMTALDTKVEVVEKKVDTVTTDVQHIRHRMKLLGWLMTATKGFKVTGQAVVVGVKEGKEIWLAVAAISSGISVVWLAVHSMWPAFVKLMANHH